MKSQWKNISVDIVNKTVLPCEITVKCSNCNKEIVLSNKWNPRMYEYFGKCKYCLTFKQESLL